MKRFFQSHEVDAQTPVESGWCWCIFANDKGWWVWANQLTLYPYSNNPPG